MAKQQSVWPWLLGGGAVVAAIWAMGRKAVAAESPQLNTALTQEQQAQQMSEVLHAALAGKGFSTVPVYVTADGSTENIIDTTAAGRNLVLIDSTKTEAFQRFMYATNALLKFNNFAQQNWIWDTHVQNFEMLKAWIATL